jgi:ACS family hexuronate transporter-like MFS transporter
MFRWRVAILVTVAIAISYLDRQTLPVAIQAINTSIPVSNEQFADLQSAFLLSYAVMYLGGGKLMDMLGTRVGFLLIMTFWSLACASHGIALTFGMLLTSRFLLGVGEGGGFPAATRAVAEWFPLEERSLAMGIINAGTAVGAVVAPPLVALVLVFANWRWVFFLTGALGLLWAVWWALQYAPPREHPHRKGSGGRGPGPEKGGQGCGVTGQGSADPIPLDPDPCGLRWLELLQFPQVWGVVMAKFLSDAAWYFYLFWLPKYLYDARGFNIQDVGAFAWIPYAAAGAGCLFGGWFSGWLVRRGHSLDLARKTALGVSAAVMPLVIFVTQSPVAVALVLFSVAYFGQQSWSTLVMTLPVDLFPGSVVGTVAGMVGFGGAIGGIIFGSVVGYLLDHGFGYGWVFALAGSFHVLAFVVILATVPNVHRLAGSEAVAADGTSA